MGHISLNFGLYVLDLYLKHIKNKEEIGCIKVIDMIFKLAIIFIFILYKTTIY